MRRKKPDLVDVWFKSGACGGTPRHDECEGQYRYPPNSSRARVRLKCSCYCHKPKRKKLPHHRGMK